MGAKGLCGAEERQGVLHWVMGVSAEFAGLNLGLHTADSRC